MDLIVSERGRTYAAYMSGGEWTEYGSFEASLHELRSWISHKLGDQKTTPSVREDGEGVVIDFTNEAGIITSQLSIDCNASDRDQLFSELARICDGVRE